MQNNSENKKKKIQDRIIVAFLTVIFITGLAVMLYPVVSDYINSKNQSRSIEEYDDMINEIDENEYLKYWNQANEYNNELFKNGIKLGVNQDHEKYNSILNISKTGVIGYLTIPLIKTELPLYHGTDESVLNIAAGHLEGTSFPVGGESTHAVISAHRGLPTSRLFTDLDKIEPGDTFSVTVLNQVLTYEVDSIKIVEPYMTDSLRIEEGCDYVTLMTCTPYGLNTHRLLVRGHRITSAQGKPVNKLRISSEAVQVDPYEVAVVVSVPLILIIFVFSLITSAIKERRKKSDAVRSRNQGGEQDEKK